MIPTSWNEIKHLVKELNPEFYEVIEEAKPSPNLKLHIVEYKYGDKITDENNFYATDALGNPAIFPKPIPQMFLLEGVIEVNFKTSNRSIPWDIFKPGKVFPMLFYTETSLNMKLASYQNSNLIAGVGSAYMLQLHSFNEYYAFLQKYYAIPKEFNPSNPFHHHKIFREIAQKEHSHWKVKALVFDKKWLEHIWQDPKWVSVRTYFYRNSLKLTCPWHWSFTLNQALRDIAYTQKIKHKEYSEDIFRQILLALTVAPAFIPAHNEYALPLSLLAKAFNTFYGTYNLPVIMHAWQSENLGETRYLSLSQNTVTTYDIKSFRPLLYLQEIKKYLPIYLENMHAHNFTCDTIYGQLHSCLSVKYFSEKGIATEDILRASDLQYDSRIIKAYEPHHLKPEQRFPERAPFLKAFIGFTLAP